MLEPINDKLSIKNLLFTKAIPNYVIPVPVNGHKIFSCTDCGDKFIFESSYNDHVNRKSAKISYMCRQCNSLRVFYNRCNLLNHIRFHTFKTATINVTDLKIEPLPLDFYKVKSFAPKVVSSETTQRKNALKTVYSTISATIVCFECKENITSTGVAYKDRATHFMQYTNQVHACPVCLFALPSTCALKAHIRLHLKTAPYYCPECGVHLTNKNIQYPYNHDCEGFKMMRATARLNCSVPDCSLFHPNDFKEHMRKYHLKKVYKCPFCVVACFNEATMEKHLSSHKEQGSALLFYQCDICPSRHVLQNPKQDHHLKSHINATVYPCWACGLAFREVSTLLTHFIKKHNKADVVETALNDILNESLMRGSKPKRIYRVVKRCDQCKRSFTYKCKYEEIQVLPSECPFKCSSNMESDVTAETNQTINIEEQIICHLCQNKISQDWGEIKKHYAEFHKAHKCLDANILLTRIDATKYSSKKKTGNIKSKSIQKLSRKTMKKEMFALFNVSSPPAKVSVMPQTECNITKEAGLHSCNVCGDHYEEKDLLEKHMISHRDPCMAYQCMECGKSFVVKPSFSKHLLLEHGITDVEDYVKNKQCYNENALMKYQNTNEISNEPLSENQCRICREEFQGPEDLEKHFRVHGMAFLMKTTCNKTNSS